MKIHLDSFKNVKTIYGINITQNISLKELAEKELIDGKFLDREDIIVHDLNNLLHSRYGLDLLEFIDTTDERSGNIELHLVAKWSNDELDTEMIEKYDQQFCRAINLIGGNRFVASIYPLIV
jgi:hypothetical protein